MRLHRLFQILHSGQVIPGKQISRAKNYISSIIAKEEMIRRVSLKVTLWEDLRHESFEVAILSLWNSCAFAISTKNIFNSWLSAPAATPAWKFLLSEYLLWQLKSCCRCHFKEVMGLKSGGMIVWLEIWLTPNSHKTHTIYKHRLPKDSN